MSVEFVLNAQPREDVRKGASRRLRRDADRLPAVVYGGDQSPASISLAHRELAKAVENEAFYSHIITLKVGDGSEQVILKDLQRHPAKARILHADFLRVHADRKITVHVPLHFVNEDKCRGVKQEGGVIQHNVTEISISCLPKDLPEFIEVDMLNVPVGEPVHLSSLTLPDGVTSVELSQGEEHDLTLAVVVPPRGPDEEEVPGEVAEQVEPEEPSGDED